MKSPQIVLRGSNAKLILGALLALLLGPQYTLAVGIPLDPTSPDSITKAAKIAAEGLWSFYYGWEPGNVPGNLPSPYYWWECGAMMMSMIDYWDYTGDTQFNADVTEAILWQTGPNNDFMPLNQSLDNGNDDQSFWAFAAMTAAEDAYPNPPKGKPQWLALVQAVFNEQVYRWREAESWCGGGLRWQTYFALPGWTYKNSIANGCFFSLGARLYRYTGNESYADWAIKTWDWMNAIGLMSPSYQVFDGAAMKYNCSQIDHFQWTYNAGVFLHGAANMWNATQDPIWKPRIDGILKYINLFFKDGIMYEVECEPKNSCNYDEQSFKAYLSRWMAATTQLAPWTYDRIYPLLKTSAIAAAEQCSGGDNGTTCGLHWTDRGNYDGIYGPGEQMAAMQIISALLVNKTHAPFTAKHGGISKGDPGAGTSGAAPISGIFNKPVTTGDRVGASFVTVCILICTVVGGWWMIRHDFK